MACREPEVIANCRDAAPALNHPSRGEKPEQTPQAGRSQGAGGREFSSQTSTLDRASIPPTRPEPALLRSLPLRVGLALPASAPAPSHSHSHKTLHPAALSSAGGFALPTRPRPTSSLVSRS